MRTLAFGVAVVGIGIAFSGGIYHEIPTSSGFYRINRFTGSAVVCSTTGCLNVVNLDTALQKALRRTIR